jgi:hypothetical protein
MNQTTLIACESAEAGFEGRGTASLVTTPNASTTSNPSTLDEGVPFSV